MQNTLGKCGELTGVRANNSLRLRPLAVMLHSADQKSAVLQHGEVVP